MAEIFHGKHDPAKISDLGQSVRPFKLVRLILMEMRDSLSVVQTVIGGGSGAGSTIVDQARTWQTLQTFKDTTFLVVDDGDATKTFALSLGNATTGADVVLESRATADRTLALPDFSGYLVPTAGYPTFGVLLSGQAYSP